jgi:hypothetical protein
MALASLARRVGRQSLALERRHEETAKTSSSGADLPGVKTNLLIFFYMLRVPAARPGYDFDSTWVREQNRRRGQADKPALAHEANNGNSFLRAFLSLPSGVVVAS